MLLRLENSFASMNEMIRQQERIANNLANANTTGFKRDRMFTEVLNERLDAELAPRSDRNMLQWADLAPGALEQTGNPLDLALGGEGFFVLTDEATGAARYTRSGRFMTDQEGVLRDPAGFAVEGEAGPITIPPGGGAIEVDPDGTITAGGQAVGKLRTVRFENPLNLRRLDGAALDANGMEPEDLPAPDVRQGVIESSNVDPMKEMTDMISHFRLFESQQKMLQTSDQVLGQIVRDLGKF